MYTYEETHDDVETFHSIYGPDGEHICDVDSKEQAEALLSHLNR